MTDRAVLSAYFFQVSGRCGVFGCNLKVETERAVLTLDSNLNNCLHSTDVGGSAFVR
jgi:hypothetical protein